MKKIEVVCAIIINENGDIFCSQRPSNSSIGGYWEFPGGKVDDGETNEQALVREIKEELLSDIEIMDHFKTINHQYPTFQITLHSYFCKLIDGDLTLTEHVDKKWSKIEDLKKINFAPADMKIVDSLTTHFKENQSRMI